MPWLWFAAGLPGSSGVAPVLAGLALPALAFGWQGNIDQVLGWYRTVTDTSTQYPRRRERVAGLDLGQVDRCRTACDALGFCQQRGGDGHRHPGSRLASPGGSALVFSNSSVLLFLIPLISPQGWVYVLLLGTPATLLLVDRWG